MTVAYFEYNKESMLVIIGTISSCGPVMYGLSVTVKINVPVFYYYTEEIMRTSHYINNFEIMELDSFSKYVLIEYQVLFLRGGQNLDMML